MTECTSRPGVPAVLGPLLHSRCPETSKHLSLTILGFSFYRSNDCPYKAVIKLTGKK